MVQRSPAFCKKPDFFGPPIYKSLAVTIQNVLLKKIATALYLPLTRRQIQEIDITLVTQ
jgi:hypothetical protein